VTVDLGSRGAFVFDLDGTIYLDDDLLPGAAAVVAALRERGRKVAFLTNKSLELPVDYARKLTRLGIATSQSDIVSSTDALLFYLRQNAASARIFVIGERVLVDLVEREGFKLANEPASIDLVVVGFDRTFDYAKLNTAFHAVRGGARLVATNPDPYCPTADGGLPDCGALLAAIEVATGARAEAIVGKPSIHMARTVLDRLGVAASDAALVGDRVLTDMRMAHEAGMASVLVLSGATKLEDVPTSFVPDLVIGGVGELLPMIAA
jgi:HAD superfamily hydrolase (TIGR01450 family)